MKRLSGWLWLATTTLAALSTLTACNEENTGGPIIFYSDIVSCHINDDQSITFEQILSDDRGSIILEPEEPITNDDVTEGQRIFLQYSVNSTPTDSLYKITPSYLSSIRSDTIFSMPADSIAAYPNDPVRINTRWRTGGYLNFDLSIQYYNTPHRLDLFYSPEQTSADTLNVILRHDSNNDLEGYWTQTYASFYIPEMLQPQYKAVRIYANMSNEALGYILLKLRD